LTRVTYKDKSFVLDQHHYLADFEDWDEDFARAVAVSVGITGELMPEHWRVIGFIREGFTSTGRCPLVYQACRMCGLHLREMESFFPAGYLRGACKLAGIPFRDCFVGQAWMARQYGLDDRRSVGERTYEVDVHGYLVSPFDWDEQFAIYKAYELKMPQRLTAEHWQVIRFIRRHYRERKAIPTVYETCRGCRLTLDQLEQLFPDGYQRGAVKIAGLRVWR